MPSDFTEYFDLRTCASRDTGYDGSRVWRFIHTKICFTKRLDEPGMSWKRDYNRAVSGMHAAVNAEVVADLGDTEIGRAEFRRRLQDQPGAITNLYFAYMLTLCALHEIQGRLNSCSFLGDAEFLRPLMQELTGAELLSNAAVQRAAQNLRNHAESPGAEVWRMRMRHRDLKQMMGCVQCNLCRVHGTVMCLGLGATMQVLLGSDGRGGDPLALDRVQVAALVATAAKFGAACETVERYRELDVMEEAKVAWLARRDVTGPTSGPHRRALQAAGLGLSNDAWAEHDEQLSRAKLAKRAWLARRDAPVWGPSAGAAAAAPEAAPEAASAPVFADDATRDESDDAASEGEAKRAWLAKQDASAWGQGGAAAAAAVAPAYAADAAAAPVAPAPAASEEAAKAAWLASRDQTGYSRDTQRRLGL